MSDLDKFVADLGRASSRVVPVTRLALERTGPIAKKRMADNFRGHARFRSLPAAVDYDVRGLNLEVGVNKRKRQGALGNIIAYGTATQGPTVDHRAGFDEVVRGLERTLADRVEGLL